MKNISEQEQSIEQLNQSINDTLHAIDINVQSQLHQPSTYKHHHSIIHDISSITKALQKQLITKNDSYLNYLITNLIEKEENNTRKERLQQYEEKIYEQRRIISDKENFYESIIRPVKKKPASMSTQQFKEKRQIEQEIEQRRKQNQLNYEIDLLGAVKEQLTNSQQAGKNKQNSTKQLKECFKNKQSSEAKQQSTLMHHITINTQIQSKYNTIRAIQHTNRQLQKQIIEKRQVKSYFNRNLLSLRTKLKNLKLRILNIQQLSQKKPIFYRNELANSQQGLRSITSSEK